MSLPNQVIDERFLRHRQRSTSIAGVVGGVLALSLFLYRHYADHRWNWDLFAVGLTIVVVKLAVMIWSHFTD
jgi:uncharacterized membrane-anchored protein